MTSEFDQIGKVSERVDKLAKISEQRDVTHREIFDRLVAVEAKVDNIDENTRGMVAAFQAAQGAFTVLDWLAKAAKPILWIVAAATAIIVALENLRTPLK